MIAIKNINAIETTTGQVSNDFGRSNGEKSTNHEFISLFNSKTDKKQLIDQSKNEDYDQLTEIELDSEKSQISSISSAINHNTKNQPKDNTGVDERGVDENTPTRLLSEHGNRVAKKHSIDKEVHFSSGASMERIPEGKVNTPRGSESHNVEVSTQKSQNSNEIISGVDKRVDLNNIEKDSGVVDVSKSKDKPLHNDFLSSNKQTNLSNHTDHITSNISTREVVTLGNYVSSANSTLNNLSETIKSEIKEFQSSGASNGSITIKIKPSILGEIIITINRDDSVPNIRNNPNIDVRIASSNPEIANYLSLIKREVLNKYGVRGVSILSQNTTSKSVTKIAPTQLIDEEKEEAKY
ncbi:hypothetical protein QX249_09175 [Vibrio parahaemolyticus]|uniref:Flagellar hook-length control protein FliK n=1 Tax=Vibrio parahaemolyticus TaxID=670 RepID=A0AAW8PZG8_VIBPH|nr:hypothetical protein [Vibrio parahaemolyticus]EGR2229428.1 hypothetical protein [Vibrio parahaemolyticus]MDS1820825.1 hypothetical protein [Vibrio parahaemolyticus]